MARIVLTHAHLPLNERIARHLLSREHSLALLFPSEEARDEGLARLAGGERVRGLLQPDPSPEAVPARFEECVGSLGGVDALVHGHEMLDEPRLLAQEPLRFQGLVLQALQDIFVMTRAAIPHLLRNKGGSIVFPLIYDSLHYADYPTSPVVDHAKLSMMKSLSRELTAFGVQVNALTIGYHDPGFTPAEKKARRERLSIYGLKPPLVAVDELLTALDLLISSPCAHLGGQNLQVGFGIETSV
jgi:3-oxoacyl-[acyl-carrier protein] reductase